MLFQTDKYRPIHSGKKAGQDMKHAYRQSPVHPDHLCITCAAFWDHESQDLRFIVFQGLPFGLSSAVLCLVGCTWASLSI